MPKPAEGAALPHAEIVALLDRADKAGVEFIKTEGLYYFDGKPAYQMGQGQK
jgi:isocitrate dehydrogenase